MSKITACIAATAILLSGCAPIYSDAVTAFDTGFTASQKIIQDRAQALNAVKARKMIEARLYPDQAVKSDDPKLVTFASIVCASSDSLKAQQAAMELLGFYDKTLDNINKKPAQNIGAISDSIVKNWDTNAGALKPMTMDMKKTGGDCAMQVRHLVAMDRTTVPEFAPAAIFAFITAAEALYDAANTTAILFLGITDDYVRGEKLKHYILASQGDEETDKKVLYAFKVLNEEAKTNEAPVCRALAMDTCHLTQLDLVDIAEKWSALRKPWHIYLAMLEASDRYDQDKKMFDASMVHFKAGKTGKTALLPPNPTVAAYQLDKEQDELNAALADYRTLEAAPSIGDIAAGMRNANKNLVRLANGELTPAEAWGIFKDYADRAQAAQKDYASLSDAAKKFVDSAAALK